jgi:glucose-6-phosphate-specific signal transduction histidine kinase
MSPRVTILYALLWILVIAFSFVMFPVWRLNVEFSGVIAVGLGYWLYGKKCRFLLAFSWIIYHFSLCEFYADILVYYQSRFFPPILVILLAWLVGELRENHDFLKETNEKLDKAVANQNRTLDALVAKLIDRRESMRIEQGEELHNGIGQEMTGIQLYCEALADKIAAAPNAIASSLIFSLRARARETHELVRWTARTLFPIKIAETGLLAALRELVAFLEESPGVEFTIEANTESLNMPDTTALQLYRISQETIFYILNNSAASNICINLVVQPYEYRLDISHNSKLNKFGCDKDVDIRVIEYRLKKISGIMATSNPHYCLNKITYTIPQKKCVN